MKKFIGVLIAFCVLCIPGLAVVLTYAALHSIFTLSKKAAEDEVLACILCIIINMLMTSMIFGWL